MGWIIGKGIGIPFRMGGAGLGSSYWATRTPTLLTLSNIGYPEGIKLDWTNVGDADYDGTSIERSADGITYAEIDTVAAGTVTYTDSTAVFQTLYYYRVRCYKGTNYSPYSNAESLEVTSDRFIITVDTTKAGSANDTFVLPTAGAGTYDYYIDWGEGGAEEHVIANTAQTHVYAAPGTYEIRIRGTFRSIYFNNTGDRLKILGVYNWGSILFDYCYGAFFGCENIRAYYKDKMNGSPTSFYRMFYGCTYWNGSFADWDYSRSTTIFQMFALCTASFNQSLDNIDTSTIQNFSYLFLGCGQLKQSLEFIDIQSATNLAAIASSTNINATGTTTNYDRTLISWATQAVTHSKTTLATDFGTAKYGEGLVDSGTTDGVAASKLIQSGQNFLTTVTVGDVVYNTTDGTYAFVTAIDSDTQLSISRDIMASGEVYRIQHSDAAKARAQLVIPVVDSGQGWTITDGGYA